MDQYGPYGKQGTRGYSRRDIALLRRWLKISSPQCIYRLSVEVKVVFAIGWNGLFPHFLLCNLLFLFLILFLVLGILQLLALGVMFIINLLFPKKTIHIIIKMMYFIRLQIHKFQEPHNCLRTVNTSLLVTSPKTMIKFFILKSTISIIKQFQVNHNE